MSAHAWPRDAIISEFNFRPSILLHALTIGEQGRDRCTPHHPVFAPGLWTYCEVVRALRDGLVPLGWRAATVKGQPLVISPDDEVAIAVASGSHGTGDPDATVRRTTKCAKGIATIYAVESNQTTLFDLLNSPDIAPRGPKMKKERVMWMLLARRERDAQGNEYVLSELSLPASITKEGFIATWQRHYILPRIELGLLPSTPRGGMDEGEDFDISVSTL